MKEEPGAGRCISVIVPVYNAAEYLGACMDSLLSQSYTNLDIILVDDGSKDASAKMCDEYHRADARVRVLHQANAGVSAARNAGLDAARGDWIGFVDADDTIEADMFEKLLRLALCNRGDMAICAVITHFSDGKTLRQSFPEEAGLWMRERALEHTLVTYRGLWNKLFSRSLIERAGLRMDTSIHIGEDILFCTQAVLAAQAIYYLPDILYHYQIRQGSAMKSFSPHSLDKRLTELDAWQKIIPLAATASRRLEKVGKAQYTEIIIDLIYRFSSNKNYAPLPGLRRKAMRLAPGYLFSRHSALKMKIRAAVIVMMPGLAGFVWRILKLRLKVSWYKELE